MKTFKVILVLAVSLLGASAGDDAFARRESSAGTSQSGRFGPSGRSAGSGQSARPGGRGVRPGHPVHFGRRTHIGVFLGAPVFAPLFYPPFGYYYDPSLPVSPPVHYIEQEPATAGPAPEPYYWYYCVDSKTYYPYVQECPGGWQQVVPQSSP